MDTNQVMIWLAVFVGGGLGSVMRYGTGQILGNLLPPDASWFPFGVLVANVLATAILAWSNVAGAQLWGRSSAMWMFMTVGICGGFSTFSTFSWDTLKLWQDMGWGYAVANVTISVVGCLLTGWWVAQALESN